MDEPSQKITGAILAGGKSRRMGRNKALLELAGKPVIERLVEQFRKTFAEVIVIANDTQYGRFCDAVFSDIYYEKGPLAGLHSALTHAARLENSRCVMEEYALQQRTSSDVSGKRMMIGAL